MCTLYYVASFDQNNVWGLSMLLCVSAVPFYCWVWTYHNLFIWSFIDGHLGYFQSWIKLWWAFLSKISHECKFSFLLCKYLELEIPRSGITSSYGKNTLSSIFKKWRMVFKSGYTFYRAPSKIWEFLLLYFLLLFGIVMSHNREGNQNTSPQNIPFVMLIKGA